MSNLSENTLATRDSDTLLSTADDSGRSFALLPHSIASAVSLAARSSSLSLRVGTSISNAAIDGARLTTLTGLELGRSILEGVLSKAGDDVVESSNGERGREAAESYLEQTLSSLHFAFTQASFWASTGFQLTSSTLTSATTFSQNLLAYLDQVFGDTESSRAIASIITLVRREFNSPKAGLPGEELGFLDLFTGTVAFALLQKWCYERTEQELENQEVEETLWDLVLLDNGRRADVVTARPSAVSSSLRSQRRASLVGRNSMSRNSMSRPASFVSATNNKDVFEVLPRGEEELDGTEDFSNVNLSRREATISSNFGLSLMSELASTADVSIRSVVTRLVTVEVSGHLPPSIVPPPGYSMIEKETQDTHGLPFHRLIFEQTYETDEKSMTRSSSLKMQSTPPSTVSSSGKCCDIPTSGYDTRATPLRLAASEADAAEPLGSSTSISRVHESPMPVFLANEKRQRTSPTPRLPISTDSRSPSADEAKQKRSKSSVDLHQKNKDSLQILDEKELSKQDSKPGASTSNLANLWNKSLSLKSVGRKSTNPKPDNVRIRSPRDYWFSNTSNNSSGKNSLTGTQKSKHKKSASHKSFSSVREREGLCTSEFLPNRYLDSSQPDSSQVQSVHGDNLDSPSQGSNLKSSLDTTKIYCQAHKRSNSLVSGNYAITPDNTLAAADHSRSVCLLRSGILQGQFPYQKFAQNISLYSRYATASYGLTFLRLVGAVPQKFSSRTPLETDHHKEHYCFSDYISLDPSAILLSSFVDPEGGSNCSGETETGVPLVHYVSLDHASKAVVLTCRGTLGFEDVLTDMTCDYDHLTWQGKVYVVHKGILASARRLLEGKGGRVMAVIKAVLEEFDDYGLVLCGHSLGGGVTAVLAMLISEPRTSTVLDSTASAFMTARQPGADHSLQLPSATPSANYENLSSGKPLALPPGRPIHVYAYGPPATVCPALARDSRGLVTTICHNTDIVPFLSLGTLRDIQAVALAFKADTGAAKAEIKRRIWDGMTRAVKGQLSSESFWNDTSGPQAGLEDDNAWPWATLKTLRANMIYEKLVPPGDVFVVETSRVLQRDAFASHAGAGENEGHKIEGSMLGRPATRVQMSRVRDLEKWFQEIKISGSMFADHTPNRYEKALAVLQKGVSV